MSPVAEYTKDYWRNKRMAKADITVGVNTKFNGEGLKKLDAGMKDAARGARTASQALGSISSELG